MAAVVQPELSQWLEASFEQLGATTLGYLKTMLRDEHSAEDVLQNVFMRLWKYKQKHHTIENLHALVFTIARREALRELQSRKFRHLQLVTAEKRVFEISDKNCINPAEALSLEEAVMSLPEQQREVLYLKIYGQLTFQEIGHTLEISTNTAASRYRYALEKIRSLLGAKHE